MFQILNIKKSSLPIDKKSNVGQIFNMLIKVTSKRQVTFPAAVLEALGADAGSYLELQPKENGFFLRAKAIDESMLAPLRGRIGLKKGQFDLQKFREQGYEPSLRD